MVHSHQYTTVPFAFQPKFSESNLPPKHPNSKPPQSTPICPKCAYDQSGEIATWSTQCPTQGTCPECGIDLIWADIFDPSRVSLDWYTEHASTKRAMLRRTTPTLWKLLIPNHYWREVGVHTQICFWPLTRWLVLLAIFIHTLAIVPVAMGELQFNLWANSATLSQYYQSSGVMGIIYELVNAIMVPIIYIQQDFNTVSFGGGGNINQSPIATIGLTVLFLCLNTAWAMIMLVVPVTRRRAQLRKAHVYRAWWVSCVCVVFNFEFTRIVSGLVGWANGGSLLLWLPYAFVALFIASVIWVQWFWIAAIKVGWSVQQWKLLSVLGSITSLLSGSVILINLLLL